jgi:two-component system OmpR family response regulator
MRILIAEDDKNFGYVLRGELAENGHEIDLALNGVEAVMKFIEQKYDFVLLDIKMPHLDGINALRIIKKLNSSVAAITYSGNAGSGEMADSVKAGAIRCLTKPFAITQLRDELKKYQSRHSGA